MGSFDNRFLQQLPGDPLSSNSTRQVPAAAWSRVTPTPVAAPQLLARSESLAAEMGFNAEQLETAAFTQVFAGNALWPGMEPWAACYGGHQFGHWAGQLGDGRAISLGEWTHQGRRFELQLKGAGPTPYSRRADGRAVLRSSLREYLCSEAMHALGVPTTRALCLISSGESVVRDILYAGDPKPEPGAIVCRVAPSFLRFGSFELPASRGELALLRRMVDFMLERDFPDLCGPATKADFAARLLSVYQRICRSTAELVAHWMAVGFVHGVMNTDNMSVLGLTLDYGPYGWLENVDPSWTPNTTDAEGRRYCFARQPQIAQWNLACLGGALAHLLEDSEPLNGVLQQYGAHFDAAYGRRMAAKLGLESWQPGDAELARELLALMQASELDLTLFFRALSALPELAWSAFAPLSYSASKLAQQQSAWQSWQARYQARLAGDPLSAELRRARMLGANPKFVLRNYLAQQAIDAAEQGQLSELHALYQVLQNPYDEQPGFERFAAKRPEWARHRAGCSMLSCSS